MDAILTVINPVCLCRKLAEVTLHIFKRSFFNLRIIYILRFELTHEDQNKYFLGFN